MITNIRRAMAMRAFFFPHRAANDQNFRDKGCVLDRAADHAASHNADRRWGLPFVVRVLFRFPALSWLPGDNPVHEAARSGVSKTLMSVPISAMMTAAVCFFTPGMVISRFTSSRYGSSRRSMCWSTSSMSRSNSSTCFHKRRRRRSSCSVKVPSSESYTACFFVLSLPRRH